MSTCDRCGISDWRPEVISCLVADCELRQPRELVEELFSYDPATGDLRWREREAKHFASGKRSAAAKCRQWNGKNVGGTVRPDLRGRRVKFAHEARQLSHIAWRLSTGRWPTQVIDHINGNPADNRISNLREVTLAENARNRQTPVNNTSGTLGVHWCRRARRWIARFTAKGRRIEVGRARTPEAARDLWERSPLRQLYHANHGRPSADVEIRHDCAGNGEPDGLVGQVQGIAVHDRSIAA